MTTDTTKPVAPELWPAGQWTTNPKVTMATNFGTVVYELAPNAAQYTVVNFLAYVNTGFYNNLVFHRVIPKFVVQGGGFTAGLAQRVPFYPAITLESHNGLSNARGTIAMARSSNPNSATSQFYVNLVNNTGLNYQNASNPGYAVFGKVVSGMAAIDKISTVTTAIRLGMSDVPVKSVLIKSATESTSGVIHDKTGVVAVGGIETGATWEYSIDHGNHWTTGTTVNHAASFRLVAGAYEANDILVRQTDAAGNVSALGHTGASVVVYAAAAVIGDATANVLVGTRGNDHIYGLAGNDKLTGGNGNDYLDGGSGRDTMLGGNGNDTYFVRDLGDVVRETSTGGIDLVKSFVSTHTLAPFVENGQIMSTGSADLIGNNLNNTLFAGQGDNLLDGSSGNDTVSYVSGVSGTQGVDVSLAIAGPQATGGSGTDTLISIENLTGSNFDDHLHGDAQANILNGGAGNDTLTGGDGSDTLAGGSGNDTFVFDTALNAVSNVDTVTDFVSGTDVFNLHADIFTALQSTNGILNADNFVSGAGAGAVATTANQHIILDTTTGSLYYDADGVGGVAQVEFARLTGAHVAVATDFVVG